MTKPAKKNRKVVFGIAIAVLLLLVYNIYSYYGAKIVLPGKKIPSITGNDPVTNTVTSLDLLKGKTIVNFWATWCGTCVKELPYLNEVSKQHRVVGVIKGPFTKGKSHLSKISFKNVIARESLFNELMIAILPTSILVENGVIAEVHIGVLNKSIVSKWFSGQND